MSSLEASAMAGPPGTIQGTTPTPPGNTTTHSVIICQSTRVKARSSSGTMKLISMMPGVCAW